MSETNKEQQEAQTTMALLALGLILTVVFFPAILSSLIFSYLVWTAFNDREERRYLRAGLMAVSGFGVTIGVWTLSQSIVLFFFEDSSKVARLVANPLIAHGYLVYLAIVPLVYYYFETKSQPTFTMYGHLRFLIFTLFWPFRFMKNFAAIFYGIVFGAMIKSDLSKSQTSMLLLEILGGAATSLMMISMVLAPTSGTAAKTLGLSFVSMYLAFYWYSFFVHRGLDSAPGGENNIREIRPEKGLLVGNLTKPRRMPLRLTWSDINHHIHILGQPGAGKSVLLKNIYANQIMAGSGLLMLDLKADLDVKEDFRALCQMAGRDKDLVIIDLSNPQFSAGYNPMLVGNATELKDKIVGAIEWSEPYYKKVSERVLQTVLRGFVNLRDQQGLITNLDDLLVSISSVQGLTMLTENVNDESIKKDLLDLIAGFSRDFTRDIEGLKTDLSLLVQSEFGVILTKPNSINILRAIQEKKVILINLDGQTYSESSKRFGRLLLGDLRSASGSIVTQTSREQRPQFTVIVDEFADIVSTADMASTFVGFLNRCRGSGIGVVIAHQSLGDFKEPTVKTQIMDSTETLFSFVQKDPETCETLAAIAGTQEEWKETEQTQQDLFFKSKTGMGSRRLAHEYIYHPNVFKNLQTGEAVYIAKKPSRHGILNVRLLEIPKINELPLLDPAIEDVDVVVLNMRAELGARSNTYNQALKNQDKIDGELQI